MAIVNVLNMEITSIEGAKKLPIVEMTITIREPFLQKYDVVRIENAEFMVVNRGVRESDYRYTYEIVPLNDDRMIQVTGVLNIYLQEEKH